jgi:heavy metal translocating P-type ATPase
MSQVWKNRKELGRLAAVAVALLLSWLEVWKAVAFFDFIALAATLIGGYPMFEEAFQGIRQRRMTMELSMSIAVIATLLIGQFFTGLVITFFVLFAELLEHLTVAGGRKAIGNLITLLPHWATVRKDGREEEFEVDQLAPGDLVIIKPGARIPVDGVVTKGNSSVDQSSITGESLPAEKGEGSEVFAGTINQTGILEVHARRIGKDTTFGRIIEIIEQAEKSRAPIQKVADKLAARLVYFAFAGAVFTLAVTHDIVSAISALIVAGACGVAAGTPLAILAGIGRTAKEGIIVKGGIYLEQLAGVDTVVVDKTGTLTLGTPQVVHIESFNGASHNEIIQLAATAEQHSEHPLARAIVKKSRELGVPLFTYSEIKNLPGQGIVCQANGAEIIVGNLSLLREMSVTNGPTKVQLDTERKEQGVADVLVAKNKAIVGQITFTDVLRSEAKQAVQELKTSGCRVILLSGDSRNVARAIGESIAADEVFGEMFPEQKFQKVRELIASGRRVAMVGDGVNDAPALVEATVGIAMGTGTDVALESANMVLMTDNLMKIVVALKISRQSLRVILFNFWGTILVDTVGITLAFLGFLTPLFAALIHVGSELAFILNSARLFKTKSEDASS